jgi:hypothetical protein
MRDARRRGWQRSEHLAVSTQGQGGRGSGDGDDLVQDGFFDVREQQMMHSAPDDGRGPMFEVGFTLDVTQRKLPGQ